MPFSLPSPSWLLKLPNNRRRLRALLAGYGHSSWCSMNISYITKVLSFNLGQFWPRNVKHPDDIAPLGIGSGVHWNITVAELGKARTTTEPPTSTRSNGNPCRPPLRTQIMVHSLVEIHLISSFYCFISIPCMAKRQNLHGIASLNQSTFSRTVRWYRLFSNLLHPLRYSVIWTIIMSKCLNFFEGLLVTFK